MNIVCFTGHRKILGAYDDGIRTSSTVWGRVSQTLTLACQQLFVQGVDSFITGGAIGVDQLAGEVVMSLKSGGLPVFLIVAKPFPNQMHAFWPAATRARYNNMLSAADRIVNVSDVDPVTKGDAVRYLQDRNIWMVDHSHIVLAVWDDSVKGGTTNCVNYARSKGKKIMVINPRTGAVYWL